MHPACFPNELIAQSIDQVVTPIVSAAGGHTYTFVSIETFAKIAGSDPAQANQIYWDEIFARAHWGSLVALLRYYRWHKACVSMQRPSNYLGFAGSLRGLVECAADTGHGFGFVPLTLATSHRDISRALDGHLNKVMIAEGLEERLIHFLYARKTARGESPPESHSALHMKAYLSDVQGSGPPILQELYTELCQIAHPAAPSLHQFMEQNSDGCTVTIRPDCDEARISSICIRHRAALDHAFAQGVNTALLTLKVLNHFPTTKYRTPSLDSVCFDPIPAWGKVKQALSK